MNYIYRLNENNNLVEEFPTDKNYNLVGEMTEEFQDQEKEFYFGYIENYYEKPWKQYSKCWISETQLEILNADNSFKYQVADNLLVESDFDNEAYNLEKVVKVEALKTMGEHYQTLLDLGYEVSEGLHIQFDDKTMGRFTGKLVLRDSLKYPFSWICREKPQVFNLTSPEHYLQIATEYSQAMTDLIIKKNIVEQQIKTALSKEDVESILQGFLDT